VQVNQSHQNCEWSSREKKEIVSKTGSPPDGGGEGREDPTRAWTLAGQELERGKTNEVYQSKLGLREGLGKVSKTERGTR